MNFSLVTAPAAEPISTAEAKTHLRVDSSDDDTYIGTLVTAARRWVENTYGLALVTQTWDGSITAFPRGDVIAIPKYPVASVTSVTYHDDDLSTSTAFSSSNYQVDVATRPPRIVLKNGVNWPADTLRLSSGVVVRFDAGYGDAADVPEDIKHAVKLLVGQMYAHREPEVTNTTVSKIGFAVDALLAPYRLWT